MSYIDAINIKIGTIIKNVQYIEWNLLDSLQMNTFEELTLGQIINLASKVVHSTAIDELKDILSKRNDLVHVYFKRLDFEKQASNETFLKSELRYLEKFSDQVMNFNDWLVE